ncbi:hypothetical protein AOL_s00173g321 [Orbilia oligospora ATCC 24927]|uniref:Methyltransferase domain-containing protein n=2 Tax=Orbilia oligospora TaxID=2813651 RepID=G1XPF3_ARTOA|nr:hypothetical protein AOL_s00173g321 [Orbilia oligospora ATCC 24927]EGX45220.1 hypothetical protein AOL_s00173g321 [Orbilia oligospora ATCC 24927]KAF3286941.1 hypothetical protein TWF970_008771 [Orbilia oligospora]
MTAPSFGEKEYWDIRFTKNPSPFDWLLPAAAKPFLSSIRSTLSTAPSPRVLHIGCGTSSLSYNLKDIAKDPSHIYNVDFSSIVVEAGESKDGSMNWKTLDLLSTQQILEFEKSVSADDEGGFGLIIDKSTADAIACADDVAVELPYVITAEAIEGRGQTTADIHPLVILSLHMAYLTAPGAKWLLLSYSSFRCSFLTSQDPDDRYVKEEVLEKGLTDPRLLWKVIKEEALGAREEVSEASGVVARPVVKHMLYTLERTSVKLVSNIR